MDLAFYWSCAVFIDLKKRFSKLKNGNNSKKKQTGEISDTKCVGAEIARDGIGSGDISVA
ncbi:hypothetical protein AXG94_14340 [Pseudomonas corrugata]|nr:hypothetical protein AXG94_14340 [Pseudomonas corrugata]